MREYRLGLFLEHKALVATQLQVTVLSGPHYSLVSSCIIIYIRSSLMLALDIEIALALAKKHYWFFSASTFSLGFC